MIIRNARVVTLDDSNRILDAGTVEVCADGSIGQVGSGATAAAAEAFDARGKLLMPALINCHTHLYSTLARGIPLTGPPPRNFLEILKKLWWRLDSALNQEDIYYSALVGLVDSAKAGVGTLVDHHASPNACPGSLDIIERAFREVGLRGALCYETSDRNGRRKADEGIAENVRFIQRAQGEQDTMVKASFGLHAAFTLGDATLRRCVEADHSLQAGFHIHVAEDRYDVEHSRRRYGKTPVRRLQDLGVLDERTIAAHCVHATAADLALLAKHRANVVHNPQSNCNNAVGIADVPRMLRRKVLVGLGSDGYSPRLWDEFMAAGHLQKLRTHDPRAGFAEAYALALRNNREIARKAWGWAIGRIATGARADLMLVEYDPPTPLTSENLLGHILFGIAHAPVHSLIVNGRFVLREGRCVNVDERAISEKAAACARKLWARW